jgi:chromate reductase, NAD(P)H dehydrogenase (quinone)
MTTLMLVPGSQRLESFNGRLLRYLGASLEGRCKLDLLEPHQVDLPIFDQDLETDAGVIGRVAVIHKRIKASHGIMVASPEYNGQLTPYLKNIVDWVSRLAHIDSRFCNPFQDHPLLLCSASTGWSGGTAAIPHARALFDYVGCLVVDEAISVPYADQAWVGETYLFDPFFEAQIDEATEQILRRAQEFEQAQSSLPEKPEYRQGKFAWHTF